MAVCLKRGSSIASPDRIDPSIFHVSRWAHDGVWLVQRAPHLAMAFVSAMGMARKNPRSSIQRTTSRRRSLARSHPRSGGAFPVTRRRRAFFAIFVAGRRISRGEISTLRTMVRYPRMRWVFLTHIANRAESCRKFACAMGLEREITTWLAGDAAIRQYRQLLGGNVTAR